jgi:hypothetical protein
MHSVQYAGSKKYWNSRLNIVIKYPSILTKYSFKPVIVGSNTKNVSILFYLSLRRASVSPNENINGIKQGKYFPLYDDKYNIVCS